MNKNAQLDFHPDAESLNAFAEQALGDRERGQIVEHLAVCSRCREVVFLAQEAAVEMEPAVAAAAARAEAVREPWFRNWRFAWVPVGAMAAVVTLAYVVHMRRVETGAEMAKVMSQAAPQIETSASRPAAAAEKARATPQPAAPGPAQSRPSDLKAKTRREEAAQLALSVPAAPPPAAAPPAVAPAAARQAGMNEPADSGNDKAAQAAGTPGSSNQAIGGLEALRQEPADAALKKDEERAAAAGAVHGLATRKVDKASADEAQKQAQTDRLMSVTASAASSEQVEVSPAPPAGRGVGGGRASSGAFAVYKAKAAGLPSGLAAFSTAVAQHSVLVVDKAGSVFLSEDSGSHWESVARQWSGRAVAVRTPAAAKEGASGGSGSPETEFELVNDQGHVWASADGKTWKIR
jgi:hypothetical protein